MNDLELIFTMLGERVTTEITKNENAEGFDDCKDKAIRGGKVAEMLEKKLKRDRKNYNFLMKIILINLRVLKEKNF